MFIYHLLKTINWIKGLLEKVCNMLYKYSLSETFRKFVLLKCRVFTLLYPTEIPNACLILEKHVRVLFEGNILLTAWLQDLHRVNLNWVDFSLSFPCQYDSCSGFVFSALRDTETFTGFFFSSLSLSHSLYLSISISLSLSRLYFANKQSPVDATINRCWVTVRLHGNFVFNWSIWCIWNSGPFINRCQCQEIIHQVNYSQINQLCYVSFISAFGLFFTARLFIMHSFCRH